MSELSPLEQIAAVLLEAGVEFIVIGGQAETIHGSARVTFDVDICYRRTRENLQRLAAALQCLEPTLRNAPPDLPFQIDPVSLALGENFTFSTKLGDLDLLGYLEPIGGYEQLIGRAQRVAAGRFQLNVIALDDLIKIKQHLGRPKDREALLQLLAIRRLREESDG